MKAYVEYERMEIAMEDGMERSVAQVRKFITRNDLNLKSRHCCPGKKRQKFTVEEVETGFDKLAESSKKTIDMRIFEPNVRKPLDINSWYNVKDLSTAKRIDQPRRQ